MRVRRGVSNSTLMWVTAAMLAAAFSSYMKYGRTKKTEGPPVWNEFRSAAGRFSVDFPGVPTEHTKHELDGEFKIAIHKFVVEATEGGVAFMVNYNDYPAEAELPPLKFTFDELQSTVAGNFNGKPYLHEDIQLDGHAGRKFRFRGEVTGNPVDGQVLMFLADRRFYQIMVLARPDKLVQADATRFIRSFRIE